MSHLSASSTHCALPRKATIAQSNVSQENRNPPEQAMAAPSICLSESPDANGFLGNSPQLWNFTPVFLLAGACAAALLGLCRVNLIPFHGNSGQATPDSDRAKLPTLPEVKGPIKMLVSFNTLSCIWA